MKHKNIKTTHNNNTTKNSKNTKNNRKKIKNWSEYNKSLKNRGNISIFISETLIKDGCLIMPIKTGKPGRPLEYTDELIEFVLTIRELFNKTYFKQSPSVRRSDGRQFCQLHPIKLCQPLSHLSHISRLIRLTAPTFWR